MSTASWSCLHVVSLLETMMATGMSTACWSMCTCTYVGQPLENKDSRRGEHS